MPYTIEDAGEVSQQIARTDNQDIQDEFDEALHVLEEDPYREENPFAFHITKLSIVDGDPATHAIGVQHGSVAYRVEGQRVILLGYLNPYEAPDD